MRSVAPIAIAGGFGTAALRIPVGPARIPYHGEMGDDLAQAGQQPRRLRADAERNRSAILAAARDIFAEQGLEAPLEDIAARAGVGIATLYRRFPAREQLVAAALLDKVSQYAQVAQEALAAPDAWAGFAGYVQRICELQADDRGLADLLSMTLPTDEHLGRLRSCAETNVAELIERAKAAGELRKDVVAEDLLLLLIGNAGVVHVTGRDAPDGWRRFVALVLDAFRCQHAGAGCDRSSLPAPPAPAQMAKAMARLASERGCAGRG